MDLANHTHLEGLPEGLPVAPEHTFTKPAHPIYKILITGGPCAGKSTSIKATKEYFTQKGFRVFNLPELPTMLVESGGMILMGKMTSEERIVFQTLLIKAQIYIENYFTKLATLAGMPAIVLCDRGCVDPAAYVSKEEFQTILNAGGWTFEQLRDARYHSVLSLVTAAQGAEAFYTLDNNVARTEGLELARSLDQKTQDIYSAHPSFHVIKSAANFKEKIDNIIKIVEGVVGAK